MMKDTVLGNSGDSLSSSKHIRFDDNDKLDTRMIIYFHQVKRRRIGKGSGIIPHQLIPILLLIMTRKHHHATNSYSMD